MHIEKIREYCLAKPGTSESFPFNETTLVFKVMGKMFALAGLDNIPLTINLKCDPERAIHLREQYPEVAPGYHMNKKHWNTITIEDHLDDELIEEWIDHSYQLVVDKLPKKKRETIRNG